MHSLAACTGQAHSPATANEQCAGIYTLHIYLLRFGYGPHLIHGFIGPTRVTSKRQLDRFCRFVQFTCMPNKETADRDMVIFRFLKMAAAAILYFRDLNLLMVGTVKRVELRHCAKFRRNRSNAAKISRFFDFSKWRPSPSGILKIPNF